jgi:hypothetical protein
VRLTGGLAVRERLRRPANQGWRRDRSERLEAHDDHPASQRRPIPKLTVCDRAPTPPTLKTSGTHAAGERV